MPTHEGTCCPPKGSTATSNDTSATGIASLARLIVDRVTSAVPAGRLKAMLRVSTVDRHMPSADTLRVVKSTATHAPQFPEQRKPAGRPPGIKRRAVRFAVVMREAVF